MESMVYRFTLDCRKSGTQKTLQGFGTGDNISRKLAITLTYGTSTYEIDTDHCEAMMYVKNPISGATSINECTIEGNTIYYTVSKTDLKNAGEVVMQVKLLHSDIANGANQVLAAPKFAIEVGESEDIDDEIEAEIEERTYDSTFTALEKAVGRAQAVYHQRLVQVEFDEDYVFHAYYADGTEYINDELSEMYANVMEARTTSVDSAALSQSYAVGGTGTRDGEDSDNSKYYQAVAKSAAEEAKDAQKMAEDAADIVSKEVTYAAFNINFNTGNVEYESSHYSFTVNEETGNLEYTTEE